MPFRSEANPEQVAMMTRVLDAHCATYGIGADSPLRESVASRILYLFGAGVTDEKLFAALIAPKPHKP